MGTIAEGVRRAVLGIALALPAVAGDDWGEDFFAAQTRAREEQRDLLLDFTGSDWCYWCKRLKAEVFDRTAFARARERYVLVRVDFPKDPARLGPGVAERNAALAQRFPIEGYPTVWLLDADARPYGRTGYREGGAEQWMEHLDVMHARRVARDAAFAAAEGLAGVERARELDRGLAFLPREFLDPHYRPVIEEILALDVEDAAGLRTKYALLADPERLARVRGEIEAAVARFGAAGDWAGLHAAMQEALGRYGALSELAQLALLFRGVAELELGEREAGLGSLTAARERDPDGRLVGRIDRLLAAASAAEGSGR